MVYSRFSYDLIRCSNIGKIKFNCITENIEYIMVKTSKIYYYRIFYLKSIFEITHAINLLLTESTKKREHNIL